MRARRFEVLLGLRVGLLLLSIGLFAFFFSDPRYHAATLLMFLAVLAQGYELWWFLGRTNREVARFLAAARYGDFSQSFAFQGAAGGFAELGETFTEILDRLKEQRLKQELELRQLRVMLDHNPAPLMTLAEDGGLSLMNNAARRLFGPAPPARLDDLKSFGEDFYTQVMRCRPGEKRLAGITLDGIETRLSLSLTEITTEAGKIRLISLHDIGRELEAAQLGAWRDLVRVLTHEIMNSITPVASLAQTTADMANDAKGKLAAGDRRGPELDKLAAGGTLGAERGSLAAGGPLGSELEKISDAAATVARRASNLLRFVANYRQLVRLPVPEKRTVKVQDLFEHVIRITRASIPGKIPIHAETVPATLELRADPEQLEQTLINLLRNAKEALAGRQDGEIHLLAGLNPRGRVTLEVSDNGPGIEAKLLDRIFVPYFTTKPGGSGIGLALARQVMVSHGGNIRAVNREPHGARVILVF